MRRHALQIVSQLPEDAAEAAVVLDLARELVETFLAGKPYRGGRFGRPPTLALVEDIEDSSARKSESTLLERPARTPL